MTDQVPIAERVKFWQEQDRINKVLIPRVLKLHERLTEIERRDADISPLLGAVEARVAENSKVQIGNTRAELMGRIDALESAVRVQRWTLAAVSAVSLIALFLAVLK
jgi:hypothetical protein